jgi:DNA-binding beta-propeller fold protein YncE
MNKCILPIVSTLVATTVFTACAQRTTPPTPDFPQEQYDQIHRRLVQSPKLELKPIGLAPARAWISELSTHQLLNGQWLQLFQLKKDGRSSRAATYLIVLNLNTGEIKEAGALRGLEFGHGVWVNDKFYIGSNMGGGSGYLGTFDSKTGVLKDLGKAFAENGYPWKMAAHGDTVAVGAAQGTEISLIDTATDTVTHFGEIGSKGHGYVYYIEQDNNYIYAALRGSTPWELVAFNKKTRERKVLLTAPPEAFMRISGDTAKVNLHPDDKNSAYTYYKLQDGAISAYDAASENIAQSEPPPAPPQVVIDYAPTFEYRPEVIIHYQQPDAREHWKQVRFPAPLENSTIHFAVRLADGRIAGMDYAYAPIVVFDPKTGKGIQAPMNGVSARSLIAVGDTVFAGGYPSAVVMKFNPDKPITRPDAAPGEQSVPIDSPQANPQRAHIFSKLTGDAHIAVPLLRGHDGRIWLTGRRHRYYKSFDVAWFNPTSGEVGVIDDGGLFDQYQVSWMASLDEGRKMVVSTYVQPDPQRPGKPGESGKLFVVDTQTNKVVADYEPLPGVKVLTGVAQTGPGILIGSANLNDSERSVYYRFNLKSGKTELVKPGARHGLPGDAGLPGKGFDFVTGPDGKVWTASGIAAEQTALFKINPQTLEVEPIGQHGGSATRYLFYDGEVLVTGAQGMDGKIARLEIGSGA